MKNNNQAQSQIDAIVAKITNGEIERVEIVHIPPEVLTRAAITPEMLELSFFYKFTIRDVRSSRYSEDLLMAMKSIVVQEQQNMPDLRWGVIYYDVNNNRVGAIYFDKAGKRGAVGNVAVSFNTDFFRWIESNFSKCFR